jgi:DNA replication protein DnaC
MEIKPIIAYPAIILHNDGTHSQFDGVEYTDYPPPCQDCGEILKRRDISVDTAEMLGYHKAVFAYICQTPECTNRRRKAVNEKENRDDVVKEQLAKAGVPQGYLKFSFTTYRPKQTSDHIIKAVMTMVHKVETVGLLFYGTRGTGKSHCSVATLRHLIECGIPNVLYKNIHELITDARSDYHGTDEETFSERSLYEKYALPFVLVLDDLGAEKMSDFSKSIIYGILDKRIRDGKKTIITTNFQPEDILNKLDERIYSRIQEFQWIAFTGKDHRARRMK